MEQTALCTRKCQPCRGDTPSLSSEEIDTLMAQVPHWTLADDRRSITREFRFKNFKQARAFFNAVADEAEIENHHPDFNLHAWKLLRLTLTTHAIDGLSRNDFIMATEIDALPLPA